jgi:hypothetical protein
MSQRTSVKGKTESNTPENPIYGGLPTPPAKVIAQVHISSFQTSNSFFLAKRTRKLEKRKYSNNLWSRFLVSSSLFTICKGTSSVRDKRFRRKGEFR